MPSPDRRPAGIAIPARRDVAAYSNPAVLDRWQAGLRAAAPGENVVTVYDVIGDDVAGGGVTVNRVDAALRRIGNRAVEVHLNSPGGDMFEGIAIFNRLLAHPEPVTVRIMGFAASAASIIAMAGTTIEMGPASFLMIHNCHALVGGNRHDMAEAAAFLAPFDDAMAGVYAQRSGQDKADVAGWMDGERWMSAEEAVSLGFADAMFAGDVVVDEEAQRNAAAYNAIRKAELALCKSMSRTEARALIAKVKGTPGAGDLSWLGAAADLARAFGA